MLRRLFFGGLHLNKGVLARFRHGLLHLSCSRSSWWLPNPEATTGPGLGLVAKPQQPVPIPEGSTGIRRVETFENEGGVIPPDPKTKNKT